MEYPPQFPPPQPQAQWQPPQYPPQQPPPQRHGLIAWFKAASRPLQIGIGCGALLTVCVVCGGIAAAIGSASGGGSSSAQTSATATPAPKATPRPTPTPQIVHYPPTTLFDVRGLAAKGDASAIHAFHSESVGLVATCPEPKREVIVDPSVTDQQLAEDLLAYFYGQHLDSPCGSLLLAYHTQSEAGDVYTAGRINLDVTDSSGQANVDPNATHLTYTLTLDIGGALSGQQEYTVTYSR